MDRLNNLTFREQDVIELLLFGTNTSSKISKELQIDVSSIRNTLRQLAQAGLVRRAFGYTGELLHDTWQYCGGPASEFFKAQDAAILSSFANRERLSVQRKLI